MKIFAIVTLGISFLMAASEPATLQNTAQLLVVTTKDWQSADATFQRFEKEGKSWKQKGKTLQVITGKNGLGWGRGLHQIPSNAKYIKQEGDGKATAGIFRLKNGFGYQPFLSAILIESTRRQTTAWMMENPNGTIRSLTAQKLKKITRVTSV